MSHKTPSNLKLKTELDKTESMTFKAYQPPSPPTLARLADGFGSKEINPTGIPDSPQKLVLPFPYDKGIQRLIDKPERIESPSR
jgi:hypothetical protein